MKKKGILVGLGNIGLKYDYNLKKRILTHSSAITKCKNLKLLYSVDKNFNNRKKFVKKYNIPSYAKLIPSQKKVDFITIAINTNQHYEIINFILENINVKLIIIEKPFCENLYQIENILRKAKKKNIKILVNYIRSFDSSWLKIKKIIGNKIIKGQINFFKDEYINASHFIHLCLIIFGNINSIKSFDKNQFELGFKNAKIIFKKIFKRSKTSIFFKSNDLEILDNNQLKIKISQNKKRYIENELKNYQLNVYDKIFSSNNRNFLIKNNLKYAVNVHKIISQLYEKRK